MDSIGADNRNNLVNGQVGDDLEREPGDGGDDTIVGQFGVEPADTDFLTADEQTRLAEHTFAKEDGC